MQPSPYDFQPTVNQQIAMGNMPMPNSYQNPMREYQGSILELTDLENPIAQIYSLLKGIDIDMNGQEVQTSEPLLNDLGVAAVLRLCKGSINRISSMSMYTEDEVPKIVMYLADTLIRDLMVNHHIYNIQTPNARSQIVNIVITMAYATNKQAQENNMKRFLKGSQQEITTRVDAQGTGGGRGKGFWKGLFGGAFK